MTAGMQKTKPDNAGKDPQLAVWRMLGLAVRAGQVQTGAEAAEQAIKRQKAHLVLVAEDSSGSTVEKILNQCRREDVPARLFGSKAGLGHWTGRDERAVAAILDAGFAKRIIELVDTAGATGEKANT